jgi:F0F1-type ATP synthase membrane subunit b/b'
MLKKLSAITLLLGLMTPGLLTAAPAPPQKKPAQNVSPRRHPNLARAQRQAENAFNSVTAAQKANEWDMEGHAAKAKDLLEQANNELKQAAQAANENKGKK